MGHKAQEEKIARLRASLGGGLSADTEAPPMIEGAVHMLQNVSKCYAQIGVLLLGSIHTHPYIYIWYSTTRCATEVPRSLRIALVTMWRVATLSRPLRIPWKTQSLVERVWENPRIHSSVPTHKLHTMILRVQPFHPRKPSYGRPPLWNLQFLERFSRMPNLGMIAACRQTARRKLVVYQVTHHLVVGFPVVYHRLH